MLSFKEVTISDALVVIREADAQKAFLPSRSEPDFSVEKFLLQGSLLGSRLFGSIDETNKLAGFISVEPKSDNTVIIGPMYISEIFRGRGLGKWQVQKLIEWGLENNIQGLSTRTWGENLASRKIFEDLGFALTQEKLDARINGDSTVKYYKKLLN